MLRALKTKLALFIRAQVAIVTEPRIEAALAELRGALADQRLSQDQIAEHTAELFTLRAAVVEQTAELSTLRAAVVEQTAELSTLRTAVVEQTAELSTLRTAVVEQTAELFTLRAAVVEQTAELSKLRALVEQNLRVTENERRDMNETQRMVGVACARIENFIKIQKEHRIEIEQSIASLHENRLGITQTV